MHFYPTRCDITSVSDNLYSVEILLNQTNLNSSREKKICTKSAYRMILSFSVTQLNNTIRNNKIEKDKGNISNKLLAVPPFPPQQYCLKLVTILLTPGNTEMGEREMEIKVLEKI